jgi:hypothetical protein
MIDSNEAITVPSLCLKLGEMGYWQLTLERLTRNDQLARFRIRGQPDWFRSNEITIFLNDEIASSRVDDSHSGFKRRRNPSKWQFDSKFLFKYVILTKSHHKRIQWWLRDYE